MNEYEAYTHIVIKRDEIEEELKRTNMQIDFLLMNIRKGNFKNSTDKRHAMKELSYLISSTKKLIEKIQELNTLATETFDKLYMEE